MAHYQKPNSNERCIFYDRVTYDKCRNCDGYNPIMHCSDYLARQHEIKKLEHYQRNKPLIMNTTRNLRQMSGLIRRANDGEGWDI